jgi:hypothetical protein
LWRSPCRPSSPLSTFLRRLFKLVRLEWKRSQFQTEATNYVRIMHCGDVTGRTDDNDGDERQENAQNNEKNYPQGAIELIIRSSNIGRICDIVSRSRSCVLTSGVTHGLADGLCVGCRLRGNVGFSSRAGSLSGRRLCIKCCHRDLPR